jgi:hypothetical protein
MGILGPLEEEVELVDGGMLVAVVVEAGSTSWWAELRSGRLVIGCSRFAAVGLNFEGYEADGFVEL